MQVEKRSVVEYRGPDPLGYVVSLNLKRRHLDDAQRAMIAARLATFEHGGDRSKSPYGGVSQAKAAELLNVSKRRVERTREVIARVQDEGTCWCGGTVWQGHTAMRISVSSWATTEADVERSLAAILRAAGS